MQKFDLTKALANPDRVCYEDETKPLEWKYMEIGDYIVSTPGKFSVCTHDKIGRGSIGNRNLFLKEPEMFVNRYENDEKTSQIYNSISEAKKHSFHNCKTYRLVEVTEK